MCFSFDKIASNSIGGKQPVPAYARKPPPINFLVHFPASGSVPQGGDFREGLYGVVNPLYFKYSANHKISMREPASQGCYSQLRWMSMATRINIPIYDESKIKTLSSLEHIRLRTGMYIGRMGDGSNPDDGITSSSRRLSTMRSMSSSWGSAGRLMSSSKTTLRQCVTTAGVFLLER